MAMAYATLEETVIVMMDMLHLYVLLRALGEVWTVDLQVIQMPRQHYSRSFMFALS
jgi:isoprenylcysteine carboxyl methyltransferase (ICMT) family protein YpbQ